MPIIINNSNFVRWISETLLLWRLINMPKQYEECSKGKKKQHVKIILSDPKLIDPKNLDPK